MPRSLAVALSVVTLALAAVALVAGPLDPPIGPIGPSYKTLTEVEPRTPINAVNTPGDQFSTFKITQPGSYYLTGNITGEADKHGIQVAVSNVTIDLNGFSMIGVDDSRSGIASNNRSGISVRNGTVYAWDGWGIDLGACNDGTLEGVVAYGNAGGGARVGAHYAVTRCTFSSNQQYGLSAGSSCTISGCTLNSNIGVGALVSGSTLTACTINSNTAGGVDASLAAVVSGCTAGGNSVFGIKAGQECVIRGNAVRQTVGGSPVYAGIRLTGSNNRVEANNVVNCTWGIEAAVAGNLIIGNSTSNCTVSFAITGTQTIGPVITASGTITSSNPWANFSY